VTLARAMRHIRHSSSNKANLNNGHERPSSGNATPGVLAWTPRRVHGPKDSKQANRDTLSSASAHAFSATRAGPPRNALRPAADSQQPTAIETMQRSAVGHFGGDDTRGAPSGGR
jgi:hypothetical protein